MSVILVTGGTGLVGAGIQHVLDSQVNETWIFVGSKDADLTDMDQTIALFKKYNPTHVIHLASLVGGIYANVNKNLDFYRLNHIMNDNVLKCSYDFKVKKVLSCLSATIFSPDQKLPYDESSLVTGPADETHEGYIWSKRMILLLNKMYNQSNRGLFTSFIPCNIFGPGDNFNPQECHFVPAVISRMSNTHGDFIVSGDGKPVRQFIYSRDLGKIIIWLIRNYTDPKPIIVSPSEEYPISAIVNEVARCYNFNHVIKYDNRVMGGEQRRTVSNKKLMDMGDFTFTPLKEALSKTVDWFNDQIKC